MTERKQIDWTKAAENGYVQCQRCGGAGFIPPWGTCFRCNGFRADPVYGINRNGKYVSRKQLPTNLRASKKVAKKVEAK